MFNKSVINFLQVFFFILHIQFLASVTFILGQTLELIFFFPFYVIEISCRPKQEKKHPNKIFTCKISQRIKDYFIRKNRLCSFDEIVSMSNKVAWSIDNLPLFKSRDLRKQKRGWYIHLLTILMMCCIYKQFRQYLFKM